jgi:LmbE family N-acetylglucosaminyl deacetylase
MHRRPVRVPAVLLTLLLATPIWSDPRPPVALDGAHLRLELEKLRVTGTALYVAAHPDDENTAMLAWLANGKKVRTAYLAMTRGDGGQNLIGSDVGDKLGVIRTQELLAARRVDDAEQYFTRAIDFGFSKGPDETLGIWGRDSVLSDVVRVIRMLRPDVIITRFATDGSGGHGHHTASAILAEEAFAAAADPARFPDQLHEGLKPWQAKRLVWNAYRFGNAGPDTTSGRLRIDLGAYDPLLGRSYTELAGESRSMHKTQGFGAAERRGVFVNTYEHRLGVKATTDLFEGVDLTWKRFPGGDKVDALLAKALAAFDEKHPQTIVPTLLDAYAAMQAIPDQPLVRERERDLERVIEACSGLWLEAVAARPLVSPGSSVKVVVTALDRAGTGVQIREVAIRPGGAGWTHGTVKLEPNVAWSDTVNVAIAPDAPIGQPYWLADPPGKGLATVKDPALIGLPENPPSYVARFALQIGTRQITIERPLVYRWVDPVYGERYRTMEVAPPVRMKFDREFRLVEPFNYLGGGPKPLHPSALVGVTLSATDLPIDGVLSVASPNLGYELIDSSGVQKQKADVHLRPGRPDTTFHFSIGAAVKGENAVVPPGRLAELTATFEANGRRYSTRVVELDYPHIPLQVMEPRMAIPVVEDGIWCAAKNVAYLMGSGDSGPDVLRELGATVTLLDDGDVETADLSRFDCIVVGVRAYNTRPRLRALQPRLLDYVSKGGRLVVQYQTADDALKDRIGPYPMTISRDRVTVEEAPMRFLKTDHPLLNKPNKIADGDFAGWVQERGLYYANPWDPKYDTPLSANDPGEPPRDGGLLYTRYGKGVFIYTGLAFFRQLPAGVPGAWRLFANLVSPEH